MFTIRIPALARTINVPTIAHVTGDAASALYAEAIDIVVQQVGAFDDIDDMDDMVIELAFRALAFIFGCFKK